MRRLFLLITILCALPLAGYERPSHIKEAVWDQVEPFLLPESHPIKEQLDRMFSQERIILSIKSMKQAGFINPKPRKYTHLVVTTHPDVPGFVFKIYLDAQRAFNRKPEYHHWLERIKGVMATKDAIEKRGLENVFKTPHKWIYCLPLNPSPPKEFVRKNFILVEEDMEILDHESNLQMWASGWVTNQFLKQFYTILEDVGLHDSSKPDNAPFTKDGRIAFIDTQSHSYWPVRYDKLTPYLSKEMKAYWKSLTK